MLGKIYLASFIFSFSVALTTYVNSTLLSSFLNSRMLNVAYVVASIVSFVALIKIPKYINIFGARKTILGVLALNILASLTLVLAKDPSLKIIGFFVFFASNPVTYFCIDLFIEHFSKSNNTGKNRGSYLLAVNLGWLTAPLITGEVIKIGGFDYVYHIAQIVVLMTFIVLYFTTKSYKDVPYTKASIIETLKTLSKDFETKSAISLNFILQFFYACMVIYSPLYLAQHFNLSWESMGLIFSAMLSAFVLFQYPTGRLTDKGVVKNLSAITVSLFIMCFALIAFYRLPVASSIGLIALVLFVSRIGAAIYEASIEYYFFKNTTDQQSNYISLFRDMTPMAYIVAPTFGFIILKSGDIRNIFLGLSVFMFTAGIINLIKIKKYRKLKNVRLNNIQGVIQ